MKSNSTKSLFIRLLTKVLFEDREGGCPRVDPDGQFKVARVVAEEGSECVTVDEELQVDAATHAGASLIEATIDVRSQSACDVETSYKCKAF